MSQAPHEREAERSRSRDEAGRTEDPERAAPAADDTEEERRAEAAETHLADEHLFAFAAGTLPVPASPPGEPATAGADAPFDPAVTPAVDAAPAAGTAATPALEHALAPPEAAASRAGAPHSPETGLQSEDATAAETEALLETVQESAAAPLTRTAAAAPRAPDGPFGLAALQAPPSPTPAAGPAAGGAMTRQIDTPADSSEFPDALATQVGYLVRDGVQQARLTLNPAEMGPVSVQIAVQGQQAQVDFAAASAATRAAIESSLSHLAAALQEAGLTLSGGGVSQHHHPGRQNGQDADGARSAGWQGERNDTAMPARPSTPVRRIDGRLDIYA